LPILFASPLPPLNEAYTVPVQDAGFSSTVSTCPVIEPIQFKDFFSAYSENSDICLPSFYQRDRKDAINHSGLKERFIPQIHFWSPHNGLIT
jgi:hypothetical protein